MTTLVKFAVYDCKQEMIDCISDKLLSYFPNECEIISYSNGASLLSDFNLNTFYALFLDVEMTGLNGMEIAKKIRKKDTQVKIIFVSDQNELAYKGYIYGAFRFVRKSNLEQDLCEAAKSLKEIFYSQKEYLVFQTAMGGTIQAAKNIKYFKADDHSIDVVCNNKTIQIYGTLREYDELMGDHGFIRIHKSYLVNFRYIRFVEKEYVILTCGKKLPLSRNRVENAKMKILNFTKHLMT